MQSPLHYACALVFVALLSLSACDSPKDREAKYLGHGKSLYESGDLVKAALEFKNALQINPAGVEAQYYLGLIAEQRHDPQAAASAFLKVADQDPRNFDARLRLVRIVLAGGDADTALTYANQLVALAAEKPEGHTLRAAALLMLGKLAEAEAEANAALAIDPANVDAIIILAGKQVRDSKPDKALALIEHGLTANLNSVDLLLVKLRLMFDQKRTDEVIKVLQRLKEIDPSNVRYVIDLANQFAVSGRLQEAEDTFKGALAANKDSTDLISSYAAFLIKNKSLNQAIDDIKTLTDQSQRAPKHVLLLEQLYLMAGKFDQATLLVTDLQQNAKTGSDRLRAQVELARITLMKGDKESAVDQLSSVIAEDSDNEDALLLRAAIMLSSSKFDNVIADARSVLHGNFNSAAALSLLSKAYAATGDVELAIDSLRSLLRIAPNDVDARLQLATLLAPKSSSDALDQLDAAIALRPDASEIKIQKAEYLLQIGATDKAEIIGQGLVDDPKFGAAAHRILGESALARSDYPNAISELQKAEAAGQPLAVVGPALVSAYVRAGKSAEVDTMLTERIAKDAGDSVAVLLLARLRAQQGKTDAAESLLQNVIESQPSNKEAYLRLAQLLTQQRRYQDVAKILETAASKFPDDKQVATFAAINADISGNIDVARTSYEHILAKWPGDALVANNLAALIADVWPQDSALLDRARQLAEKSRNSSDPILLDTLGWVLARQGNFDDAAILLSRAASFAQDNQQIQYHYAIALSGKGLREKAREAFGKALAGNPDYRGLADAKQQAAAMN